MRHSWSFFQEKFFSQFIASHACYKNIVNLPRPSWDRAERRLYDSTCFSDRCISPKIASQTKCRAIGATNSCGEHLELVIGGAAAVVVLAVISVS